MLLGLPAGQAIAASWCAPARAPNINIRPQTDQISYDFSLSEKQLNGFRVDTVNPYAGNVITDVGGLMKGGIETQQKMTFGTMTNRDTGQVCYWFDSVNVDIRITPTVYVARDFPKGSCMHNAILNHEHKHVIVDREMVNKYGAIMGQEISRELMQRRIYGPVSLAQENQMAAQMKGRMAQIMNTVNAQMSAERKARQQKIDSLAEYESINHMCKK